MGRYDKLKVRNGSSFVQPSRVRYYQNNAWQDLGTNDSDNQRSMYVYTNSNTKQRVTLNKHVETVVSERYVESPGGFNLLPSNGYCYCPNYNSVNTTFIFDATVRKTSDTDKNVFYTGGQSYNGSYGTHNEFHIIWRADGKLQINIQSAYSAGGMRTFVTDNAVGANQWAHISIRQERNSNTMVINFNGASYTISEYRTWVISPATNQLGEAGVQFKDTLTVQGSQWSTYSNNATLDMNTINGNGGQYQNVTHVEVSSQVVTWI